MNLIQRIVQFVVPPPPSCGHEEELHHLRNQVQAARLARGIAERDLHELQGEVLAGHPSARPFVGHVDSLRLQREMARRVIAELQDEATTTNARLADLEAEIREAKAAGFRAQTSFPSIPTSEALPTPEDEVVSDNRLELAYRLVGLYFEGRQHWILARGEERIKAPIHDADWLEQMRRGEVQFRAGDTLLAEFRVITYRRGVDVWAEHTVERVLRVIHADEQIEMRLSGDQAEVAHA